MHGAGQPEAGDGWMDEQVINCMQCETMYPTSAICAKKVMISRLQNAYVQHNTVLHAACRRLPLPKRIF